MHQINLTFTGKESTRVRTSLNGEKIEVEPGETFECDYDYAKKLCDAYPEFKTDERIEEIEEQREENEKAEKKRIKEAAAKQKNALERLEGIEKKGKLTEIERHTLANIREKIKAEEGEEEGEEESGPNPKTKKELAARITELEKDEEFKQHCANKGIKNPKHQDLVDFLENLPEEDSSTDEEEEDKENATEIAEINACESLDALEAFDDENEALKDAIAAKRAELEGDKEEEEDEDIEEDEK